MSQQTWSETVFVAGAAGTAIASSVTETIIFPNITIPANYVKAERCLRVRACGQHSTTGTPTLIFRIRWGGVSGTLLWLSPTFTTGSGVTANLWELDVLLFCRASGATGTIMAAGPVKVNGATLPFQLACVGGIATPAATTVDLTADTALSVTAQWGTNSASNTLTGHLEILEALN
jgi:hypothetical protein